MADGNVRVVAIHRAKPEKAEALREVLLAVIEPTRSENGCITYELHENRSDPTEFTFVEEWTDEDALNVHLESEHIQGAIAQFPELLADDVDLRLYDLIG